MSIRHDLVDLILMALDNDPPPPIERVSGNAGRRARVENGINAILARYAVVELPEGEQDDDGQTWFDDYEIRVDHTGRHGAEVYLNKRPVHPSWLRARAAEYLAAARDAEAQS